VLESILIMSDNKEEIQKKITGIEAEMNRPDFWADKASAQEVIKEYENLKLELEGVGKYDKGNAIMTIFSGAGGDDSEDFSAMLLNMYSRYVENKGWGWRVLHQNQNDHGGYRNVTVEIKGKNVYGKLKNESGVHRLVRLSPFNANQLRHTSFSMVEVIPEFDKVKELEIPEQELRVEFARSSGPGGQNVNKRETAVRVVHIPTGIAVHSEAERSQADNRAKALSILAAKLYKIREEERIAKEKGMYISKTTTAAWGNQIRSYVLHPYKMVKDHRTNVETSDTESVLNGELDTFIEAEKEL